MHRSDLLRQLGFALVLAGALVVLQLPGDVSASATTFGGRNGKLVYEAAGGLYVVGPAGGRGAALPTAGVEAAWSRDGRRLAFAGEGIFVARADGSGLRDLTALPPESARFPESGDYSPSWFPDGQRILFHRELVDAQIGSSFNVDLFVVRVTDRRLSRLTWTPGIWEQAPALSPDGKTVVFALHDERRGSRLAGGLFLLGSDGTRLRRLTRGIDEDSPSWSPDGRQIAFVRTRFRSTGPPYTFGELHVLGADGAGLRRLTQGAQDYAPVWSPDGRWITFCRFSGEPSRPRQYLVRAGGGTPRRLPLTPVGCVTDWQALPPSS